MPKHKTKPSNRGHKAKTQSRTDRVPDKNPGPPKARGGKFHPVEFYRYSGMAIKMAVVIFAGVYGGIALDEKWNLETPWMTILLSLVGVSLSIYIVVRDTRPR